MNTNCNRLDSHQGVTTKNSCAHPCAHKSLWAIEPQPAPREAASKAGKFAENGADKREKNLHRAIVVGAVLILALVAVVFYLKFAALDLSANAPTLEIQSIARY